MRQEEQFGGKKVRTVLNKREKPKKSKGAISRSVVTVSDGQILKRFLHLWLWAVWNKDISHFDKIHSLEYSRPMAPNFSYMTVVLYENGFVWCPICICIVKLYLIISNTNTKCHCKIGDS